MKLHVVFFGGLQRLTGCREDEIELAESTFTINSFAKILEEQFPAISAQMSSIAFSIDDEIVDPSRELRDGDVVGLLPPVSGG